MAAAATAAARDPAPERTRDPEDAEAAVGPLLARANLLRMRGQWDEAVAACTEALRKAPESPTAHALLGDIYEAQGKLDDALQWYGMAVDLNPDSKVDRAKLDRLVNAQRVALLQQEGRAGGVAGTPPAAAGAGERTLQWFDRLFPPGKSDSIARLILAVSGAIALLILFAAAFVYFAYGNAATGGSPPLGSVLPPDPAPVTGDAPIVVQPPAGRPGTGPAGAAAPSAGAADAAARPPRNAPPAGDGKTALRDRLARALPDGVTLTQAQVEPGSDRAALEVLIPPPVSASDGGGAEPLEAVRARVLRAAAYTAHAALLAEPALRGASVRVLLGEAAAGAAAPAAASPAAGLPQLAFAGEVEAAALRVSRADPAVMPDANLRFLFSSQRWAGFLDPAVPPDPTPPAGP